MNNRASILIDCGLFQGAETSPEGAGPEHLEIEFPIDHVRALVVTHVHIDHVGRIPYLLAKGFNGPIYCSEPSAILLPLVLEDALKIGFTRDARLVSQFLNLLQSLIVPLPYKEWRKLEIYQNTALSIRLHPAGHILGSAYVECKISEEQETTSVSSSIVIFSGDLGAPWAPLLSAPKPPWRADVVVLESTYGDHNHEDRRHRRQKLQEVIEHALHDRGTVLIPAFSIGRTQELLYELEDIIHRNKTKPAADKLPWNDLEIIVDSPLASKFTEAYRKLQPYWDAEARRRLTSGRHPLSFEQITTIDSHQDHLSAVDYLTRTGRPSVVIAASGMCAGGRIVNYLKAMIGDARHDILFVGYQARGTPGRIIQEYGPGHGYIDLDNQRYTIHAKVHTIGGYSAHAGQNDLINFIRRMRHAPKQIRLVHGEDHAKQTLKQQLEQLNKNIQVTIPVW